MARDATHDVDTHDVDTSDVDAKDVEQSDAERWQRVDRALDAVLSADPRSREEREAALASACGDDDALRREVASLLDRVDDARRFLDAPPSGAAAALLAEARSSRGTRGDAGRRVGAYRIVEEIGRGGMSRVFLAERADGQFAQRVALKLLRPGLDAEIDRARFAAERQILATLNHPNIARLLDGGVTDDGVPYLVLEHVDGLPIDRYADERGLTVAQRLALFLAVCDATQYAHRALVVHRDLKPSNILVTRPAPAEAGGVVKLLDFGLAKLLDAAAHDLPDGAYTPPTTRTGHGWMTPEYAAPEQVRGESATTLTDVYQLGAVLHELLTGAPPFGRRATSRRALEDAILGAEPPCASAVARTERDRRALRGDVDAIVATALRKEPARRYASPHDLAADVRRHLAGHPVQARSPGAAHRAWRFVARHPTGIVAAVLILALSVAYVGTVVADRARIARALHEATSGTRRAEQVTDFMLGLFEESESGRALTDTVTAREMLGRGLARARALAGQPEMQAQMLDVLGRIHTQLGDYDQARPLLEEALGIRRRLHGELHPDVATSIENLATARDRENDVATVQLRREALALRRRLGGDDDPHTIDAEYELASALHRGGDVRGARPLFEHWLATIARRPREVTAGRARQLSSAALFVAFSGRWDRALALDSEALAVTRAVYGERHPAVADALIELADALRNTGHRADAVPLTARAIDMMREAYPQGHPSLAHALRTLGVARQQDGHFAESIAPLREALAMQRRFMAPGSLGIGTIDLDLAWGLAMSGDYVGAERYGREALAIMREHTGEDGAMTAAAHVRLGEALRGQRRFAEAESMLLDADARLQRTGRSMQVWRNSADAALARLYDAEHRPADAARYRAMLPPAP